MNEQNTNHALIYLNNIPRYDLEEIFTKIFSEKINEIKEDKKEYDIFTKQEKKKPSLGGLFFRFCKIYIEDKGGDFKQRIKSIFKKIGKNRFKKRNTRRKQRRDQMIKGLIEDINEVNL